METEGKAGVIHSTSFSSPKEEISIISQHNDAENSELMIMKQSIREFLEDNNLYNMLMSNSIVPAVDETLSILDLIYIFEENDASKALIWSRVKQDFEGIFLGVDLINLLLSIDLTKIPEDSSQDSLETLKRQVQEGLGQLTIAEFRSKYKTFKNISLQTLVTGKLIDSMYSGITKLKENRLGHLIIVDHALPTVVGIVNKMDFLMFVIKNYYSNSHTEDFLNKPIREMNIGQSGAGIYTMQWGTKLRDIFAEISQQKLSCVPVINENHRFVGVIQKWHVLHIFRNIGFAYLDKPAKEFLQYLDRITGDPFEKGVGFIDEGDTFKDVIQKFIFSRGQAIYLDSEGRCIGLITINDIINYLI